MAAKKEKFLTVDLGATSVKLCEFVFGADGRARLSTFGYREYEEEVSEETRLSVCEGVLRQLLLESGVTAKKALVSISGQTSLLRFGKISTVSSDKKQLRQLVEFEAKRNIPFALDEITLDYQLITSSEEERASRTASMMSVVVKNDVLEQYAQAIRAVGLEPVMMDVAPVACYNSAVFNGLGQNGDCALLVSIGGRTTNLIFIEGERFFARTIPIAGHSITQQIAKEFGIGLPEAEELKRHHGFVGLGGAYADPVSETASAVSKIIRNVMSRLHGEISRSINIYRTQMHGNTPAKIYLTGGSAILTYCDLFFNEKFGLPVEYFNPFGAVVLGENVDRQKLSEVAHTLSESVGLGFRYTRHCNIEINLLPRTIRRQQAMAAKKPYFVAAMICLAFMLFVVSSGVSASATQAERRAALYAEQRAKFEKNYDSIKSAIGEADDAIGKIKSIKDFLGTRAMWPLIIEEVYRAKPDNVWIDAIEPIMGEVPEITEESIVEDTSGAGDAMGMGMGADFGMSDMGMGGGGMGGMGDMGMGDGMGGMGLEPVPIAGLLIRAHVVKLPGDTLGEDPELPPEPKYPFEVPGLESASEDGENAEGEEGEESGTDEETAPRRAARLDQSGENLFVRNLGKSSLFGDDPLTTGLLSRSKNEYISNGADFEIQVKLNVEPTAYEWDKAGTTGNGNGGMGGMGGMGGAGGGGMLGM